jgi:RNA polymerase sigma factor (TIGR02999 family)
MTDPDDEPVEHLPTAGDRGAFDQHFALVYHELRQIAEQQRRRWDGENSLNTTALVHEAYLRLGRLPEAGWRDRPHFMATAAKAMRQILIDHARRQHAAKRGSGRTHVPLEELEEALNGPADASDAGVEVLVALDDALRRLDAHDARQARIVECRFFAGMGIEETADALGVSPATVKRGWAMAQAWLHRELSADLPPSG